MANDSLQRRNYIEALNKMLADNDGCRVLTWLLLQMNCGRRLPVEAGQIALFNLGQSLMSDMVEASPKNALRFIEMFYAKSGKGNRLTPADILEYDADIETGGEGE